MCECVSVVVLQKYCGVVRHTRTQLGCVASIVGTVVGGSTSEPFAQFIFPFRLHITNINIINGFATWTEQILFI